MNNAKLLQIAKEIVNQASDEIIEVSKTQALGAEIGEIGASGHSTKLADMKAEEIVKNIIKRLSIEITDYRLILITEETGLLYFGNTNLSNSILFVLDPLDGSNNLKAWRTPAPFVSISLAAGFIENENNIDDFESIQIGVVRDIFNKRLYFASRGDGAFVEEFGEIKVSPEEDVLKSVIGVDIDVQVDKFDRLSSQLIPLLRNIKCQRRLGSSILDFCKVASGEYDAFVSLAGRMGYYDIAAAKLIIEEAGGIFNITSTPEFELLESLFETNDSTLLEKAKYSVIASGTIKLNNGIQDLYKN